MELLLVTLATVQSGYPPCDDGCYISDEVLAALALGELSGVKAVFDDNTSELNTTAGPFTPARVLFIPSRPAGNIPFDNLYRTPHSGTSSEDERNRAVITFKPQVGDLTVTLRRIVQAARGPIRHGVIDLGTVTIEVGES